jgi:hypothetical protein
LPVCDLLVSGILLPSGWAANSINARVRLAAENDRLKQEAQLLKAGGAWHRAARRAPGRQL